MEQRWFTLLLVFLAVVFAFLATVVLLGNRGAQGRLRRRLATVGSADAPRATAQASPLVGEFGTPPVDRVLRNWSLMDRIALGLVQANLHLRLVEYLLLRALLGLFLAALGLFFTRSWPVAGVFLLVGYWLPRYYVRWRAARRVSRFLEQLPDALALMANGLRAGFGLLQVIQELAQEMAPPFSEEFQRVSQEMALGEDMETAFAHLQTRLRSYDLDLIVTAMLVQRRVGGNLAEVLDGIAHTIRERVRILGEVRALTGEVRLSGNILAALPFVTALAITIITPTYLEPLFLTVIGRWLTAAAALFLLVGIYMLRRLSTIEV